MNAFNPIPRFIWADRLVLWLSALTAAIWALCWAVAFAVVGAQGAHYLWLHFGARGTQTAVLGLMTVWVFMRLFDFALGGATYRLCRQAVPFFEARLAKAAQQAAKLAHHFHGPQIAR
jgi:hypothetical protein